jgi:DNA-binding PadR family transcriptional regulator
MPKVSYPRYIVLGLLGIQPMSGYDIKKWVDASFRFFWDIGYGQIYPTLRVLEEEGLVRINIVEDSGPKKKVYAITEEGLSTLVSWLHQPEEKELEILLKLYFGDKLPGEILKEKILAFGKTQKDNLDILEKTDDFLSSLPESKTSKPYLRIVSSFGRYTYESRLEWVTETIRRLEEIEASGISRGGK